MFFHGKECEYHAGKHIDERKYIHGKKNPDYKKPMRCAKGSECAFNHRPVSLREKTERRLYEEARKSQAPVLHTDADLFAAYPTLEWKFANAYATDNMSDLDVECLKLSLERSGWDVVEHGNYFDIIIPPYALTRGTRSRRGSGGSGGNSGNSGNSNSNSGGSRKTRKARKN